MDAGFYIILGLLGSGYFLSKDGKNNRTSNDTIPSSIQPSGNNIYDNNHLEKVEHFVQDKSDNLFEQSLDPESKIISQNLPNKKTKKNNKPILAGDGKPFTHNNMTPFYKGTLKQNLDLNTNNAILENYTGVTKKPKKHETTAMFKPIKQNIHGISADESRNIDRMYVSDIQRGTTAIKQTRVGKGMGLKANELNSGGFHDTYRPPQYNVDELRVKGKERLESKGTIIGTKGINQKRTFISDVAVNNKADVNEQLINDLAKTTSDLFKPSMHSETIFRDTQQLSEIPQGGIHAPNSKFNDQHDIFENGISKITKPTLDSVGFRNMGVGANKDNFNEHMQSIDIHDNQRNLSNDIDFSHNVQGFSKGESRVHDSLRGKKMDSINNYIGLSNPGTKDGYQNLNINLDKTRRETTSVNNYTSAPKSYLNKNTDQSQYANMNINSKRELISQGREPKGSSTKLNNGIDKINFTTHKKEKASLINTNELNKYIQTNKTLNYDINNIKLRKPSQESARLQDFRTENPYAININ